MASPTGATSSTLVHAEKLARAGYVVDASRVLEAAGEAGDPEALFLLATWRLRGQPVPRDLPAAHRLFGRAAEAGHPDAQRIHRAFLAHGAGGLRDWPGALAALRASADAEAARQLRLIEAMALGSDGDPLSVPKGDAVGAPLPVTLFRGFCSPLECRYLIDASEPYFGPAVVVDPRTGAQIRNPVRTSDWTDFGLVDENPAIHAINRRIAAASGTTPEQGEPLQVLRYAPGQEYRMHSDALPPEPGLNQRILTFLIYLNDDYDGGATFFESTGLALRPQAGDAVLFRNTTDDGRMDLRMRHAGQPVTRGVKYLASRWVRERPVL